MSSMDGRLDDATHARIFNDLVVPESKLNFSTAQDLPRAIITAGQPGAGKSRLVRIAEAELSNNAVVVDPDELREYHPEFKQLREAHPYTWSSDTNQDAGRWASKLRKAAIDGRRNIIFDTTLANADPVIKQIREMQAKGYQVEIRAIAAHRLESELGIGQRFMNQLECEGFGRHVPGQFHDFAYDALPANLDKVREKTDARVRIFSREGEALYDSHTSPLRPSAALEQAREDRLTDPHRTRGLRDGWRAQGAWEQRLSESLVRNPQVSELAVQNALRQNSEIGMKPGVTRGITAITAADRTVRIEPNIARAALGLKIAGTAALAYDTYTTTRDTAHLLDQDNATGAQSQVLHFGARNLGMAGGAAMGASIGAAMGVESGPGLLATGFVGGIVGAIGGDMIMDAVDQARIYNQRGGDGNLWHLDAQQPEQGWTRTVRTGEIDPQGVPNPVTGEPAYKSQTLHADPRLADELNYKASSVAVEFALARPHRSQDPKAEDGPQAIAQRYQNAYDQYGWSRHGTVPAAVTTANRTSTQERSELQTPPLRIDQPGHPGHALFQQAQAGMRALDAKMGRSSDQCTDNVAASLAVTAHREGLTRIDHVLMGSDNKKIWAAEGKLGMPLIKTAGASIDGAMVPVQQTSQTWDQAQQQRADREQLRAQELPQPHMQMHGHGMRMHR